MYRVRTCCKCPGDTEYFCTSCLRNLCQKCNKSHEHDVSTIDHETVKYHDKFSYIPNNEISLMHSYIGKQVHSKTCKISDCYHCKKQAQHKDSRKKYEKMRKSVHTIRSGALLQRRLILTGIKADVKTCHTEFSLYQSEMLTKAQKLKDLIDLVQKDFMNSVFSEFNIKHRCLKQKTEMSRYIASLQNTVHSYEQSANRPLQFLSSIKTAPLPQIYPTLHTSQFSMTESLNKEAVMGSLSAIQVTQRGNRRVGNQCLLKLMSAAEFHHSVSVTGVGRCFHISYVTPERIWVSDWKNIFLTNTTTGDPIHVLEDFVSFSVSGNGSHTVTSEHDLIYVSEYGYIKKLSNDMKTTTTFIDGTNYNGQPRCLCWSSSSDSLLVGWPDMFSRHSKTGQLTDIIEPLNKEGEKLYINCNYMTENNNGDIVVSDSFLQGPGAVVVMDCGGRHRFSYKGHSPNSRLEPQGICVDAMSNILVCDFKTNTVHIVDKDGHFLSHLLTRPLGLFQPYSLCYDFNTHHLWVGSNYNNKVCVYKYLTQQNVPKESQSKIIHKRTRDEENHLSSPTICQLLEINWINNCLHISCVSSDRAWISSYASLVLTNTAGDILHCLQQIFGEFFPGSHTLNKKGELIYIKYDILKLAKDMETTTILIERKSLSWVPLCLFCSRISEDIFVGMINKMSGKSGKVVRYNQSGQPTQTIQHDDTGLELYCRPHYITENNNGDVAVSEPGAVVVTDSEGRYRFCYTGHPSGSGLQPKGICTNVKSQILVCDTYSKKVHILDKNGIFLSHLIMDKLGFLIPHSLGYDANDDILWVGCKDHNYVRIFSYKSRQDLKDRRQNSSSSDENILLVKLFAMPLQL